MRTKSGKGEHWEVGEKINGEEEGGRAAYWRGRRKR